ncbi:hypothetical protein WDZ92_48710 [Nostoc sp. NIES-2111]
MILAAHRTVLAMDVFAQITRTLCDARLPLPSGLANATCGPDAPARTIGAVLAAIVLVSALVLLREVRRRPAPPPRQARWESFD